MSNPLESIWNLLFGPGEAEKYQEDPAEYLAETGLDQYEPAELHDLVVMAYEKGPVYQGASVNVGGNQAVGATSYAAPAAAAPAYAAPAYSAPPPPPPLDPTLPPAEALEQTVNYYVTNSTTTNVDDRDTNVDSSVNTNVIAEEGSDLELDIDTETNTASGDAAVAAGDDAIGNATGDGAVAAGDDINAPVNTGTVDDSILADESSFDGVAVGENNEVVNDSTNVATGSGDVSDDDVNTEVEIQNESGELDLENVNFGQGNSIDDSTNDSFNETNTDSFNETETNTDSFNETETNTDSFNETATDSFNNDNDGIDDSFNEQSQVGDESFNDQEVEQSFNDESLVAEVELELGAGHGRVGQRVLTSLSSQSVMAPVDRPGPSPRAWTLHP